MSNFNKEQLAELLRKAIGPNRSLNQYSKECQISCAHISRLSRGVLFSPPSPNNLKKMAEASEKRVSYQELMLACGYTDESVSLPIFQYTLESFGIHMENYSPPSEEQKRIIKEFIEFTLRNNKQ